MHNILQNQVLVLNKSWLPVRIETAMMSIKRAFAGHARFIDENTIQAYTWEEWLTAFSLSRDTSWKWDSSYFSSTHINIRLPSVIVLNNYNKVPRTRIRLTKKNLLIRDRYLCQYSSKRIKASEATIDHVMPRSRGGKHEWHNVVICCKEVNIRKGNRTPEEAGITLLKQPREPSWTPMYGAFVMKNIPKKWEKFLGKDYYDLKTDEYTKMLQI